MSWCRNLEGKNVRCRVFILFRLKQVQNVELFKVGRLYKNKLFRRIFFTVIFLYFLFFCHSFVVSFDRIKFSNSPSFNIFIIHNGNYLTGFEGPVSEETTGPASPSV
uniref:Uncharacterized protein n=1 Tax=Octopus bimaculoides TaxID=37653 RepID=A0A0L8H9H4_OCTBM